MVLPQLPAQSVDLILCDLPFGITDCDWDKRIPFEPLWAQWKRVRKPNAATLLFAQGAFMADLIASNRKEFRYEWIWRKTTPAGFANARKMPLRAHENICVFYARLPTYNPQFYYGKPYKRVVHPRGGGGCYEGGLRGESFVDASDGKRYPQDVLVFPNKSGHMSGAGRLHPTEKPVPLLEYLIRTYTNEGGLVLDNCMGSGSTCVACVNTGRAHIGIEKDDGFYNTAVERLNAPRQGRLQL